MNTIELISKKKNGYELTAQEISYLISGYNAGDIPDYQMAAFLMAVCFRGMTDQETTDLTLSIIESGDILDLSDIEGIKVDKHSTGGVGDTTTLILGPLVAAAGVTVAKLSGRGLGHTGGTIDKLESIEGLNLDLEAETFIRLANETKIAISSQTANLTPADKKLYALRDVTATVDSMPLIASSIMSKKIAAGADAILLDVKTGDGAFMRREEDAMTLAKLMVSIGKKVGRRTVAVISDMSQPLGFAIGNSIEVIEAIQTLQGNGPKDLTELTLVLGTQILLLAKRCTAVDEARRILQECIADGSALKKFQEFVKNQNGKENSYSASEKKVIITATNSGVITRIAAQDIGVCAMELGAGRKTKTDAIDHASGILLHKKVGDRVEKGEALASLCIGKAKEVDITEVQRRVHKAFSVGEAVVPPKLIRCVID